MKHNGCISFFVRTKRSGRSVTFFLHNWRTISGFLNDPASTKHLVSSVQITRESNECLHISAVWNIFFPVWHCSAFGNMVHLLCSCFRRSAVTFCWLNGIFTLIAVVDINNLVYKSVAYQYLQKIRFSQISICRRLLNIQRLDQAHTISNRHSYILVKVGGYFEVNSLILLICVLGQL